MNSLRRLKKKTTNGRVALTLTFALAVGLALVCTAGLVWAGNAHFVGNPEASCSGDTLTVSGKVAGLGDEPQICVAITADALCINPGQRHPRAENKESVVASGEFPVQNGKADFDLSVTATFQPSCSPPMTILFRNVILIVTDGTTENNCTDFTDINLSKRIGTVECTDQ